MILRDQVQAGLGRGWGIFPAKPLAGAARGETARGVRVALLRLMQGICQSVDIVPVNAWALLRDLQANNLPTTRGRESVHVEGAQVIGVRFRQGGQRPKDGGGVRVHISQGGHGLTAATLARAQALGFHGV